MDSVFFFNNILILIQPSCEIQENSGRTEYNNFTVIGVCSVQMQQWFQVQKCDMHYSKNI